MNDGNATDELKAFAAEQLRTRGAELDERTEAIVTKLAGARGEYGGYDYGGLEVEPSRLGRGGGTDSYVDDAPY